MRAKLGPFSSLLLLYRIPIDAPCEYARALHLDRQKPTDKAQTQLGAGRHQRGASTAKKPQKIQRRGIVHGIRITATGRIQDRLTIQKLGMRRNAFAPCECGVASPPPPRSAAAFDAKRTPIAPSKGVFYGGPQRRVVRQPDDDVARPTNDAQNLVERLSDIGKMLDDFKRDHSSTDPS